MQLNELRPNDSNRYRALWEFANGVVDVKSLPSSLQLAKSNSCNFKCVYCIDHRPGNQIPRNRLQGDTWRRLLGLISSTTELGFHGISEFFIDPDFFDLVRRCADAGASLSLNTNGSVCTPRHLDALVSYPGSISITFSLDAATPETFLRIRGADFWRILENIKSYMDRFAERRSTIWTCLSFVITKSNVREMLPFVFLAKSLSMDAVTFFRLHEYDGLDWQVDAKDGGRFNYRDEIVGQFREVYNRELQRARKAAETLGIVVELPAPLAETELVQVSV